MYCAIEKVPSFPERDCCNFYCSCRTHYCVPYSKFTNDLFEFKCPICGTNYRLIAEECQYRILTPESEHFDDYK